MNFSFNNVLTIIIIYQALMIMIFLVFDKKTKPLFLKVLTAICVLIFLHFSYLLFESRSSDWHILLGPFFGLIYGPLNYIYIKTLTSKKFSVKRSLFHLVPAMVALIVILMLGKHLFSFLLYIGLVITAHYMIYLLLSIKVIYRYRVLLKDEIALFHSISLYWLEAIVYIQIAILVFSTAESIYNVTIGNSVLITVIFFMVLVMLNCFYFLGLKQVRLFEGLNSDTPSESEYTISKEIIALYSKKLESYLEDKKPYLEFNLTLDDLSNQLQISKRNLSHVINKVYGKNFYDFINGYRLEIAKTDLLNTEKAIKEIMYDSGFANKSTFNFVFKKHLGLTPSAFRNKNKK